MLSTGVFQTRGAKVIAAVVAVLLLAAFQVAMQAKPAHAWQMKVSISGAGSVVETTPAHLLDCSSSSTTPTGTVGATCFAGTLTGDYGNFWDVDYTATPASGYSFVRWESDGGSNPIICDRSSPAATSSTYSGSNVCKFRATGNLQTRVVFADTTDPWTPSISGTTPTRTNQAVSFNFQTSFTDPTFKQFECRVTPNVQTSFQPCTTGISFNPSDGTYTFEVRAVDWSGNASTSASRTWTVDKTGPNVMITSPSPGTIGGKTNSTSATFTFSSPDPSAQFLCKLDSALTYSSCSSPKTYTGLTEGQHTFTLSAQDSLGNVCCIVSQTWMIDLTPPDTTLDPNVGPNDGTTTPGNDPVFEFTSSEIDSSFECNLQGPGLTSTAFTTCTSPKGYANLPDGTYTFKVRAKDSVGNADNDLTTSTRTWTILNRPTVLTSSLIPIKGVTGVSRTTDVKATFSEAMASTSITNSTTHLSSTFKLQQWVPATRKWKAIPAIVTMSGDNKTATLDPYGATETTEKALAARTKFRAMITTAATDAAGNHLAKTFMWTFTTGRR